MSLPFPTLFEDEHVLVVAKPAGLLSVAVPGGEGRNLADLVRREAARRGGTTWPVHRLDRDTSGAIAFAKTAQAKDALEAAFRERRVAKSYVALVNGAPPRASGTIKTWIVDRGKAATSSRKPVAAGREAITKWRIVERFAHAALLEAEPLTGRFNQIRLHMADLGCPLVGERKYAVASRHALKFKRPLLHAARLAFPHPATGATITVEAPLPDDFARMLDDLRG